MDTAKDRGSGRVWSATEYTCTVAGGRPDELVCTGKLGDGTWCDAGAYFVRRSRDGREEHFAARHRGLDCDEGSRPSTSTPGDAGHQVPALTAVTNRQLKILTGPPAPSTGPDGRRRSDDRTPGDLTRRHAPALGALGRRAPSERHLKRVLSMLVVNPGLIPPWVMVRADGIEAAIARRFFAPLGTLTVDDAHREGGFYGVIARIYVDDDQALRIYVQGPAGTKPATVLLRPPAALAAGLDSRAGRDAVLGHHLLVLGVCRAGKLRPYVLVANAGHIATQPPA